MDWGQYTAFVIVAAAIVATPGPDTLLIIRNALRFNRGAGFATLLGIQCGLLVHISLAVAGLSTLLYFSEWAFRILAFVGALYLGWLGLQTIRHGVGGRSLDIDVSVDEAHHTQKAWLSSFRQGVLCNILNPKVVILFIALLPSFVNPELSAPTQQIIILGVTVIMINVPFQAMIVLLCGTTRISGKAVGVVNWTLGGVLLFFSAAIVADHVLPE